MFCEKHKFCILCTDQFFILGRAVHGLTGDDFSIGYSDCLGFREAGWRRKTRQYPGRGWPGDTATTDTDTDTDTQTQVPGSQVTQLTVLRMRYTILLCCS